jgi:hypothetical protein
MKFLGYILVDSSDELPDNGDGAHIFYPEIEPAWGDQRNETIYKAEIKTLTELEVIENYSCPGCCDENTTGLKEDDRVWCTSCNSWQESTITTVEVDDTTKTALAIIALRLLEQGLSKEKAIKIMKQALEKAADEQTVSNES